jgi:hypothetical protein
LQVGSLKHMEKLYFLFQLQNSTGLQVKILEQIQN